MVIRSQVLVRSTAFREQHGKSIRSIVINSTRESTNSRRQATRELFGIKQACVYNPSSQGRLRAFSFLLILNSF